MAERNALRTRRGTPLGAKGAGQRGEDRVLGRDTHLTEEANGGPQFAARPIGRGVYGRNSVTVNHSMLGLGGLFEEMARQGVTREVLLANTGLTEAAFDDPTAGMTHRQKIQLFSNVKRLTSDPAVGLRAGQRQRLSDFGVFGYALASSATLGEAAVFGIEHVKLVGPVLEKSMRIENGNGIFSGHDVFELNDLLPLMTEFWFSTTHALIGHIMERPFRSISLTLPYAAPAHAALYESIFQCRVQFGADDMEWRFNAAQLNEPCPNANRITARMCADFCDRMLNSLSADEPDIVRAIRLQCLNNARDFPTVEQVAMKLKMTPRTLHRRLSGAGLSCQDVIDNVRRRLAEEFLRNTRLSVEEIAGRTGFSDASNFRKAFKRWSGDTPADYRRRVLRRE